MMTVEARETLKNNRHHETRTYQSQSILFIATEGKTLSRVSPIKREGIIE